MRLKKENFMKVISSKEKDTISSILDEAEADFDSSPSHPFNKLLQIDQDCKDLWPSWNGSFYIPSYYNDFAENDAPSTETREYVDDKIYKNQKTPQFSQNSPENDPKIEFRTTTTRLPEAAKLADEVDNLKYKVTEIMSKLSQTVHSSDSIPPLINADPIIDDDSDDESIITMREKNIPLVTKEEERRKVIALQREIIEMKKKNQELEEELLNVKKDFISSQKRIVKLTNDLKNSSIILEEMKKKEEKKLSDAQPKQNILVE